MTIGPRVDGAGTGGPWLRVARCESRDFALRVEGWEALSTYSEALRCTQADWPKLEKIEMDSMTQDAEIFFERRKDVYPLFELFEGDAGEVPRHPG